jgi:GTPase SAR1 family protein
MFSLVSGVYQSYWSPQQINLLIIGAVGSGKTSLLERIKVTEFDSYTKNSNALTEGKPLPVNILRGHKQQISTHKKKKEKQAKKTKQPASNRRSWVCPSPAKYQQAQDDSSDDDDSDSDDIIDHQEIPPIPEKLTDRGNSLESVELNVEDDSVSAVTVPTKNTAATAPKEYDLKRNAKMLPLSKVRPTIGMNLGKVDVCGAKCRVWDLGGQLQNLWERYYDDCDACIFVWKLPTSEKQERQQQPFDEQDEQPVLTLERQQALLEQVRKAIPDDVPLLVLVHFRDNDNDDYHHSLVDHRFTTAPYLLPNYHNPFQALFLANAQTGQGVRSAMNWLISLAKQQQRLREKPLKE